MDGQLQSNSVYSKCNSVGVGVVTAAYSCLTTTPDELWLSSLVSAPLLTAAAAGAITNSKTRPMNPPVHSDLLQLVIDDLCCIQRSPLSWRAVAGLGGKEWKFDYAQPCIAKGHLAWSHRGAASAFIGLLREWVALLLRHLDKGMGYRVPGECSRQNKISSSSSSISCPNVNCQWHIVCVNDGVGVVWHFICPLQIRAEKPYYISDPDVDSLVSLKNLLKNLARNSTTFDAYLKKFLRSRHSWPWRSVVVVAAVFDQERNFFSTSKVESSEKIPPCIFCVCDIFAPLSMT